MEIIEMFLTVAKSSNDEENEQFDSLFKAIPGVDQVQIVKQSKNRWAQILITFSGRELSFNSIESIIHEGGRQIKELYVHFSSVITNISDPYGASAASLPLQENLNKIEGVLEAAISATGKLKVKVDTDYKNKQIVIDQILKFL